MFATFQLFCEKYSFNICISLSFKNCCGKLLDNLNKFILIFYNYPSTPTKHFHVIKYTTTTMSFDGRFLIS